MAAPKGNRNAAKGKDWETALRHALDNYEDGHVARGQALREIGKTLVGKAIDGDMMAIREIGDRLDGKPAQTVDATLTHAIAATELSDEELARIAAGGGTGALAAQDSPQELH